MKEITIKEFMELAKKDEELKSKIAEIAAKMSGELTNDLAKVVEESGYKLVKQERSDMEELSDDEVQHVAGGGYIDYLCYVFSDVFDFDSELCD